MKPRNSGGYLMLIVALSLVAESVAINGYKWYCKHGSEQFCLMTDTTGCTCLDLSLRCSEENSGSDEDDTLRVYFHESRSDRSASESDSSGQINVRPTQSIGSIRDIFDYCIQEIDCQDGNEVFLHVNDKCRECFTVEDSTTETYTTTPEAETETTTEATTTEQVTTVTTMEATTTEGITAGPIFSEIRAFNFPDRLKRRIEHSEYKRSSSGGSRRGDSSSSSSGDDSYLSGKPIVTKEPETTTEAVTQPTTTPATTTEAITVGPIFTELAIARDPVVPEVEGGQNVEAEGQRGSDEKSDSSSNSYSESGDSSTNGDDKGGVNVNVRVGDVIVTNKDDSDSSQSISREGDGYSISIDISKSDSSKYNTSGDSSDSTTGSTGYSVCSDDDLDLARCPTVTELMSGGCSENCLTEDDDGCPACNCECLANTTSVPDVNCDCGSNQQCLRIGRFGLRIVCVDLLSDGERCDGSRVVVNDSRDDDGSSSGEELDETSISDSSSSSTDSLSNRLTVNVGCQEGLVCTLVSAGRRECRPVQAEASCTTQRLGQDLVVSSGDFFLDVDGCMRCLCQNGEATSCEPIPCIASQQAPSSCTHQGQSYRHGERFQEECNLCGCNNGNVLCTQVQCEAKHVFNDKCQECVNEEIDQVCGNNGLTYPSSCAAMHCGGLSPSDYVQGNCPSVDVCSLHPCDDGELCIPNGGVTCLSSDGCDSSDLRTCVDLDFLVCEDKAQNQAQPGTKGDTAMCATNGITYPSLCRLLQDTGNEDVAYAGECDRDECQGGSVCGSDGVTYENKCVMKTQSANAVVDFYGECDEASGRTPEEICKAVKVEKKCLYNASNCPNLVKPEEGCCEVCGGIVFVAIDLARLREYISVNPKLRTLDAFIDAIHESGFINQEVTEKCEMEVSLMRTGNIQIYLSTRKVEDSAFCSKASSALADAINDPSSVSGGNQVPDVLQFASAAITAETRDINGVSGSIQATSSFITMVTVAFTLIAFIINEK